MDRPSDPELLALKAQQAHRFPVEAKFYMPDGDDEVGIFVVLGHPSGACKMPLGAVVSSAWDTTVAATFKKRDESEASTAELVADCVLWPEPSAWAQHVSRWPALPEAVNRALRQKLGSALSILEEPKREDARPACVQPALAAQRGSIWRRLKPGKQTVDVVIGPPDQGVWQMFTDAMKKRDAKHGAVARDMAAASLRAAFVDEVPLAAEDLLARWPGMSLLIDLVASALAGLTARYELGES